MIKLNNITKDYVMGSEIINVLRGISLEVNEGEFVAIMGPSGSGKSTLMNMIGMLDNPTSGSYFLGGRDVAQLPEHKQSSIRGKEIGFIFQQYNLIARMAAIQQVMLPLEYQNLDDSISKKMAIEALKRVGLGDKLYNKPTELSWWQQQRVSIARAIVVNPKIILADEPTGALDSVSWEEVLKIMKELHQDGRTLVVITHAPEVASQAQRVIHLRDGLIV